MFLPVDLISEGFQPNSSPFDESIYENAVSNWSCPWSSAVIDVVAPYYRRILKANSLTQSYFIDDGDDGADDYTNLMYFHSWWAYRYMLDIRLNDLLREMQDKWIGPWECLFLGERLDAESLEFFSKKLSDSLSSQCDFIFDDNLIKVILNGAHSVLAAKACIVQSHFYKGFFGWGECGGEQRFRAFADHSKKVKSVLTTVESLISEAVDEGMKVNRQPIILVLDSDVQMIPWESMPILKNQEVYRMPSLDSILLKLNDRASEKNTFELSLPCIDPFRAYYLLDPDNNFELLRREFEGWFQNLKWEGKSGNVPAPEELLSALQNHDLFLYFGHNCGMQYIGAESFKMLSSCAAAFLMGCCSGSLRQQGCYASQGAPLHYLFAGSPAIVATLWEITDVEIATFAKIIINSWTQDSIIHKCNKCIGLAEHFNGGKSNDPSRRKVSKSAEIVEKNCKFCEAKLRIISFISEAKGACTFPTLTGASIVCYGVPTFLKR